MNFIRFLFGALARNGRAKEPQIFFRIPWSCLTSRRNEKTKKNTSSGPVLGVQGPYPSLQLQRRYHLRGSCAAGRRTQTSVSTLVKEPTWQRNWEDLIAMGRLYGLKNIFNYIIYVEHTSTVSHIIHIMNFWRRKLLLISWDFLRFQSSQGSCLSSTCIYKVPRELASFVSKNLKNLHHLTQQRLELLTPRRYFSHCQICRPLALSWRRWRAYSSLQPHNAMALQSEG